MKPKEFFASIFTVLILAECYINIVEPSMANSFFMGWSSGLFYVLVAGMSNLENE